jgi:hypothetical protein
MILSECRIEEDAHPPKFGTRLFWVDSPFQRGRNAVEVLVPDAPRPGERFRI